MAMTVVPAALSWRNQDGFVKHFEFSNDEPGSGVWIEVAASPPPISNTTYYWGALPRTPLLLGARPVSLHVRPPLWVMGVPPPPLQIAIPFTVTNDAGQIIQQGSLVCRNDGVSNVAYGDVQVTSLVFNAPGPDLEGEGEYLDILNLTARDLNLSQCRLTQATFNRNGVFVEEIPAGVFPAQPGPFDFVKRLVLPAHQRLRVLTRGKTNDDPVDDPLRHYLGSRNPIWNNTGDRVTLYNADGDLLAQYGYGRLANVPGRPNYQGPDGGVPDPVPQLFSAFTVDINAAFGLLPVFAVEDGDVLEFSTDEQVLASDFVQNDVIGVGVISVGFALPQRLPSGSGLLILPRRIGSTDPAPDDGRWPLGGAARYSLIGAFGEDGLDAFAIGAGRTVTVSSLSTRMLHLGVNDDRIDDNGGVFRVHVRVFRV